MVKTAQLGFPRRGEQEEDRREAVRQHTPSRGCAGTGLHHGSCQSLGPEPRKALPEVFCRTLGKPLNVHGVLVFLWTKCRERGGD